MGTNLLGVLEGSAAMLTHQQIEDEAGRGLDQASASAEELKNCWGHPVRVVSTGTLSLMDNLSQQDLQSQGTCNRHVVHSWSTCCRTQPHLLQTPEKDKENTQKTYKNTTPRSSNSIEDFK